jgi:hypothetical protein
MRVGYSYWGFLGDNKLDDNEKVLSTPDGNATYSWSIIHEMQRRGWQVYMMQNDRDWPGFKKYGRYNFDAFSSRKRMDSYLRMLPTFGENLPELDVLILEWRFPIPGRNTVVNPKDPNYQPDLDRQNQLLDHYKGTDTKIIFWDLDHKVLLEDETRWKPDAIFETSVEPRMLSIPRTRVEPPIVVEDLLQHPTLPSDPKRKLVYIGSRYERDDVITEWIKPTSDAYPNEVEFWGNWLRTVDECRKLWPNVNYNDRITTKDFRRVYGTAGACPLLAKRSYLETGFITPRPWEALMFGTIPIGLAPAKGITQYAVHVAHSGEDMIEVAETLAGADLESRDQCRKDNVEMLEFMDARHFVDKIQEVA